MYNTEIIYKIAPRGEGKTKWLTKQALNEYNEGNEIFLLTRSIDGSIQFRRFLEFFFINFNKVATVHPINDISYATEGSVVLIDDLLDSEIDLRSIKKIKGKVKKIYITIEGIDSDSINSNQKFPCDANDEHYEQLTINFDNYNIEE